MGEPRRGGMSRRVFLAGAGVASSSVALVACSREGEGSSEVASLTTATLAFDGECQAGIATPTQANLNLVGFNLKDGVTADGIRNLMQLWTEDARELAAGRNPLSSLEPEMVERPANLTITCGFGERVFDTAASGAKPQWLHDIPTTVHPRLWCDAPRWTWTIGSAWTAPPGRGQSGAGCPTVRR